MVKKSASKPARKKRVKRHVPAKARQKTSAAQKPAAKKLAKKALGKKKTVAAVSPLAPKTFAELPPIAGVVLGTANTGIRYKGRDDLLVALMPAGTSVAGVFTTSKTASAPVDWCRSNLADTCQGRALVVNAGNANAFTGKAGMASVRAVAAAAAERANCRQKDVFIASTGVVGQLLPPEPVIAAMDKVISAMGPGMGPDRWREAADAISTTDTYPKMATRTALIGDRRVTINGIAKGSGMIAPDMATMLAFIFTDAAIESRVLQTLLMLGVRDSFNAITVDSDTSTSDTVLLFATGEAEKGEDSPRAPVARPGDLRLRDFRTKLHDLMLDLAHQVVRDGEGARKFIQVTVNGAASYTAARRIAMSIANSPLVKTAIAGEDANWGRIVMAVGKAGEAADRDRLAIQIGGVAVAKNGAAAPDFDEAPVTRHMRGSDIEIDVDVGVGKSSATVWTCDLTYDYIRINADYRS